MEEDREEVTEVSQTEEMKQEEKIFTPLSEVSSGRAGASLALLLLFVDLRPAPPLAAAANQEPAFRRPRGAAVGGSPQVRPSHRAGERAHLFMLSGNGSAESCCGFWGFERSLLPPHPRWCRPAHAGAAPPTPQEWKLPEAIGHDSLKGQTA